MKIIYTILCVVIVLLSFAAFKALTVVPPIDKTIEKPIYTPIPTRELKSAEKLETLVNEWREQNYLKPLIHSENLCRIAEIRLEESSKVWSHDAFAQGIRDGRYCKNCTLAENLSRGYPEEKDILDGWIGSPSHLKALQTPYTHSCIKLNQAFTVQIFGYY